eukprot:782-Rhodomonas_salina.2
MIEPVARRTRTVQRTQSYSRDFSAGSQTGASPRLCKWRGAEAQSTGSQPGRGSEEMEEEAEPLMTVDRLSLIHISEPTRPRLI